MRAQEIGIIKQFGDAEQGKLASQQFADSGLRYIKKLFKLPRSKSLLLDYFEDVLMEIGLQFKLQTVLLSYIKLIKNASRRPMGAEFVGFASLVAVHGDV